MLLMRALFTAICCGLLSLLTACGGGKSAAQTYTVAGTLSGVGGSGLNLQLNGGPMLALSKNGDFVFSTRLAPGTNYIVATATQPTQPSQTCVATNASGTIGNSNIANVMVACTTNAYAVGGTVTGLAGSGLILQDNAGDDLSVTRNGSFSFTTHLMSGSAYLVTVESQPTSPTQTCTVTNASATLGDADVTSVAVVCTTNSFSVGGTVSGLIGTGLVLELNGGDDFPVVANGNFTFPRTLLSGANYAVTVKAQPSGTSQTCILTNSLGVIGAGAVMNTSVTCATNAYTIGGTVAGLSGSGLVLQVNGGQDLSVGANGAFVFPTALGSGIAYAVTIKTQPVMRHEVCLVTNASGMIAAMNVSNVSINCSIVVGFVYVIDPDRQLVTYGISAGTGAPMPLSSPIAAGSNPTGIIAAPGGNFLYVSGFNSNSISVFAVQPNQGALTTVGLPVATGSEPASMVFAPSGAYLFVSTFGDSTVTTYEVNATTGALTQVGMALSFASQSTNTLALTPDGRFLYVLTYLSGVNNSPPTVTVSAYAIDAGTAALTAGPVMTANINSEAITIDPTGRFLFLNTQSGTPSNSTAIVLPYAINPNTAALTAIGSGTTIGSGTGGSDGYAMTAEPTGKYLYVISNFNGTAADDNIIALAINQSTGVLSQIGPAVSIGSNPRAVVCDPSGQFVYVGNGGIAGTNLNWNDVSAFTIDAIGARTGQLSPSGQGTQFSAQFVAFGSIAIVE
jgi:6-phosphogluconolactonase (cycloisomerase 2 family)